MLSGHGITLVEYATFNLIMSSTNAGLRSKYVENRNAWDLRETDIPTGDISEFARSLDVRPVQVHCPNYDLSEPDQGGRSRAVAMTERVLKICAKMEVPTLVVHSVTVPESGGDGNSKDRLLESLRTLARSAADLGCRIAVENGWRDLFGSRAEDLVELIEGSDPDYICACLDTGHSQRMGLPPASMARKLGRYLGTTHIHDYDGKSDHIPPFTGDIDWKDLASALNEIGYGSYLIGEIEGSESIDDGILQSRGAMDDFLGLMDTS